MQRESCDGEDISKWLALVFVSLTKPLELGVQMEEEMAVTVRAVLIERVHVATVVLVNFSVVWIDEQVEWVIKKVTMEEEKMLVGFESGNELIAPNERNIVQTMTHGVEM